MKRKYVYGLLAVPVVIFLVYLMLAGESRATFFTEFKHNIRMMMGYERETYTNDGEMGLRSEHPDEYGHVGEVEGEVVGSGDDASQGEEPSTEANSTDESPAPEAAAESSESAGENPAAETTTTE